MIFVLTMQEFNSIISQMFNYVVFGFQSQSRSQSQSQSQSRSQFAVSVSDEKYNCD